VSLRIGVAAAHFGRDLDFDLARATSLVEEARASDVQLLVLPHGTLGGYLGDLDPDAVTTPDLPPALPLDDRRLLALAGAAGPLVVCLGVTEARPGGRRANTAVCLSGAGVHGTYRKVHLNPAEARWYDAGDELRAFDTPAGRLGLLVDYDKTFPEAARTLALDGAQVLAIVCAWPLSRTQPATRVALDRQSMLFDLYDRSRAAENQVVVATANQSGSQGALRFLSQAKVVLPDGTVAVRTGFRPGLAVADVDVPAVVAGARRHLHHLRERRPAAYASPALVSPERP
jgi:predicted amidohydrolase